MNECSKAAVARMWIESSLIFPNGFVYNQTSVGDAKGWELLLFFFFPKKVAFDCTAEQSFSAFWLCTDRTTSPFLFDCFGTLQKGTFLHIAGNLAILTPAGCTIFLFPIIIFIHMISQFICAAMLFQAWLQMVNLVTKGDDRLLHIRHKTVEILSGLVITGKNCRVYKFTEVSSISPLLVPWSSWGVLISWIAEFYCPFAAELLWKCIKLSSRSTIFTTVLPHP